MIRTFLPLLTINRGTSPALVHGPLQFWGMKVVKQSVLQDQWGLSYLIQSLRWDKTMAKDIRTYLDAYQLVSGFVCDVFWIFWHTNYPSSYCVAPTYPWQTTRTGWEHLSQRCMETTFTVAWGQLYYVGDFCEYRAHPRWKTASQWMSDVAEGHFHIRHRCHGWPVNSDTAIARLLVSHCRTRPHVATASPTKYTSL